MSKNVELEVQLAKKKDLEAVLTLVLSRRKQLGKKASYNAVQQALYPLLKKENNYGLVWLFYSGKNAIGYAVMSYSYSLESGGREGVISEFHIEEDDAKTTQLLTAALDSIVAETGSLALKAIHLDSSIKQEWNRAKIKKLGFTENADHNRMTRLL